MLPVHHYYISDLLFRPFEVDPFVALDAQRQPRQKALERQSSIASFNTQENMDVGSERSYEKSSSYAGMGSSASGGSDISGAGAIRQQQKRRKRLIQMAIIGAILIIALLVTVIAIQTQRNGKSSEDAAASSTPDSNTVTNTQTVTGSPSTDSSSALPRTAQSTLSSQTSTQQLSTSIPSETDQSSISSPAIVQVSTSTPLPDLPATTSSPAAPASTSSSIPDNPDQSSPSDSGVPSALVQARSAAALPALAWSNDLQSYAQDMLQYCCDSSCEDWNWPSMESETVNVIGESNSFDQALDYWLSSRAGVDNEKVSSDL